MCLTILWTPGVKVTSFNCIRDQGKDGWGWMEEKYPFAKTV